MKHVTLHATKSAPSNSLFLYLVTLTGFIVCKENNILRMGTDVEMFD